MSAVRIAPGKYHDLQVAMPDGITTKFFLDPDKSRRTISLERSLRVLRKKLGEAYPDRAFKIRKSDFTVFEPDWTPICRLFSPGPGEVVLRWAGENEKAEAIRASGFGDIFEKATADPSDSVQWV